MNFEGLVEVSVCSGYGSKLGERRRMLDESNTCFN